MDLMFRKTGLEIKEAVRNRAAQLQQRLDRRNRALDQFMRDASKLRSYLVRSAQQPYSHGTKGNLLSGKDDISSEEKEEISRLCLRIFEIEQELHRLSLVVTHLDDNQVCDLDFNQLVAYGFTADRGVAGE